VYRVLIADDDYEDRELLKLEITRALKGQDVEVRFYEAPSVARAMEILRAQPMDLLTLDIEFDKLNEGLDALPGIFDQYPMLNLIVVSGKLNKAEVTEQLFRFTKDNVLKSKRWVRHFDVLDKKDDKTGAIIDAFQFSLRRHDSAESLRELFAMAEGHLESGDVDKCLSVYRRIQDLTPGERESADNIKALEGQSFERALDYLRRGDTLAAALMLGYHVESRLKAYARRTLGRSIGGGLADCLKELEKSRRMSAFKRSIFLKLIRSRNRAVHSPSVISEEEFEAVRENLILLEAAF